MQKVIEKYLGLPWPCHTATAVQINMARLKEEQKELLRKAFAFGSLKGVQSSPELGSELEPGHKYSSFPWGSNVGRISRWLGHPLTVTRGRLLLIYSCIVIAIVPMAFIADMYTTYKIETGIKEYNLIAKASLTIELGGTGKQTSKEIKVLECPPIAECKDDLSLIPGELPIALGAHVAMDVPDLGLLVCGGLSDDNKDHDPGKKCFLNRENTSEWQEFKELNTGRLFSYMKVTNGEIRIIGGTSPHPSNPCLQSEEVLNLSRIEEGWKTRQNNETENCFYFNPVIEVDCD